MKLSVWKFNILAFTVLLGLLISLQFKNGKNEYVYVPLKIIRDYKLSIETATQEIEDVEELIKNKNEQIQEYEKIKEEGGKFKETMLKELKEQKLISGFVDIEGPGVILTVNDGVRELAEGEHPNNVLIHDVDMINLINDLKIAGAEAISINGQRLLSNSELSCAGHTIRINNQFFAQPFIVKAVGEPKMLEAALIAPGTYGALLREFGLYVEVNTGINIKIPKYSEDIDLRYLKDLEEGE